METAINLTRFIFMILLGISFVLFIPKIVFLIIGMFKQKPFEKASSNHKFAIIIPARNESKVIRGALNSIQKQTYDSNLVDTFVIVPNEEDKSIPIVKEYKNTYLHVLDHKVTNKGATMDSLFKLILKNAPDYYDAYIIVDADNILEEDFVEKINDAYSQGYDIVLGGRQNKNWEDGWISNCSALTFSYTNGMNNKARTKLNGNILISGSGLMVDKKIIQDNDGWPWQTLTEDYELSQVSFIKNYKVCYYEHAKTYDEQPTSLKQSNTQLTRWIKGHNTVDKKYRKDMIKTLKSKDSGNKFIMLEFILELVPLGLLVTSFALFMVLNLSYFIISLIIGSSLWLTALLYFLFAVFGGWALFMVFSTCALICDRDNILMDNKNKIKTVIMSPIFFIRYIPIYLKCLRKKEVTWDQIEHNKNV